MPMAHMMACVCVVLSSITIVASEAAKEGINSVVHVLHTNTFEETTKEGFWLVEFYAPWCGHCKKLNPILDEVSQFALEEGMHIGKVDTTVDKKLATDFDISGYPTLKFRQAPGDEWKTYKGGRKGDDLMAFAERMKGDPLPTVASAADLDLLVERATSGGSGVAFLFGGGGGRDAWLSAFGSVARSVQHESYCGSVAPGASLSWTGGAAPGTVPLPGDGKPYLVALEAGEAPRFFPGKIVDLDGADKELHPGRQANYNAWMVDWMVANDAPLFNAFGAVNFRKLGKLGKLLVIAIVDPSNATSAAYLSGVTQVARKLSNERHLAAAVTDDTAAAPGSTGSEEGGSKVQSWAAAGDMADRFIFGSLDGVKWSEFVEQFNVFGDLPRLVVMDMPKEVFYEDPQVDEADEAETFLREVADGKVPAQREGNVKKFMAKIQDMGWHFYAMMLPLVLSLLAFCFSKPADDFESRDDRSRRDAKGKKRE